MTDRNDVPPEDLVRITLHIRKKSEDDESSSNYMEVATPDGIEIPPPLQVAVLLLEAAKAIIGGTIFTQGDLS